MDNNKTSLDQTDPKEDYVTVTQPETEQSRWLSPLILIVLVILILVFTGLIYYVYGLFNREVAQNGVEGVHVQTILDRGKLIIGTDATYPPMEYYDNEQNLIGYDIDLGTKIAQELGVEVEFKDIAWDDVFQDLLDGKMDMIIAGVSISEERKAIYDFSDQYLNAGQVIITQKDNDTIMSTDDLEGKKIGVQMETTNEQEALKYTADENVIRYPDFNQATAALVKGEVDAIFSDLTNAKGIVDENYGLKIASAPFTSYYYGIVMRQGEEDLVTKVNSILNLLRQRGVLTLLNQKWLE